MKRDEKICPQCAETVKKAAHLCKHCGYRFPDEAVKSAQKEQSSAFGVGCAILGLGLVFLLFMCAPSDDDGSVDGSEPEATETSVFADEGNQHMLIVTSQEGIKGRLRDPDSAEFRNTGFYSGSGAPAVCGEVNARNGFGGYTGYQRFIAAGEKVTFLESDLPDPSEMGDAWKKLCIKGPDDEAFVP